MNKPKPPQPKPITPTNPKGAGAPKKEIDFDLFEKYLVAGCTEENICGFFGIDKNTLIRCLREKYGEDANFSQLQKEKENKGRSMVRMRLFTAAMDKECSPAILIYAHKVYTGFRENEPIQNTQPAEPTVINIYPSAPNPSAKDV